MASAEGVWQSWIPDAPHLGETYYLCSSTLSSFAGLLPNGEAHTALCRMPIPTRLEAWPHNTAVYEAGGEDRHRIDCGNRILRTLHFSVRNHSGTLVPLGESNWSATLVFGFPDK